MDQEKLRDLLAEATVDCYGEEENFMGVLYTLEENLQFPLRARALGQEVEVIGLDDRRSGLGRGIVANVLREGKEYKLGLSELEFIEPDPDSAEWLAMYRYWLGTF